MQPLCGQAGFGGGGLRGGSSCFWEFPKIVGAFLGVPKTIVDGWKLPYRLHTTAVPSWMSFEHLLG